MLSMYKALASVPTHPTPPALQKKKKNQIEFPLGPFCISPRRGMVDRDRTSCVLEEKAGRINLLYFVCFTCVTERYELYTILCND